MENIDTVINGLKSENKESIKDSLKIIKEDGDLSIVPKLIGILRDPSINREIHQAVLTVFSDIRDSKFPEILGKYIQEEDNRHLKAELIKICWETPINMSSLLPSLVEALDDEDFEVRLEASTALEEQLHFATAEMLDNLESKLQTLEQKEVPFVKNIIDSIKYNKEKLEAEESEEDDDNTPSLTVK